MEFAIDETASDFLKRLIDESVGTPAFFESTFEKDFILLAEFCEIEGPKPIFTIPSMLNSTFNLNTFAVRIMSVDCVSIMQTTDFKDFKVAGDIQVVLSELSEGAVAYVHHFVLYDVTARGFVRPFCLAYITKHHSTLMKMFEKLTQIFTAVSTLFHFGNAFSFINDIMLRLHHLRHLRTVLASDAPLCDVFMDEVMLTESQKNSITRNALDEAMAQLSFLMNTFSRYVDEERFGEHRELFSPRYLQVMDSVAEDERKQAKHASSPVGKSNLLGHKDNNKTVKNNQMFGSRPCHKIPSDVISSILGRKYDKQMRSLQELCDVTSNVGIDILNYFLHILTTQETMSVEDLFVVEPAVMKQACRVTVGNMEFPFISQIPNQSNCCMSLDDPILQNHSDLKTFLWHFMNFQQKADDSSPTPTLSSTFSKTGKDSINKTKLEEESLNHSFLSLLKYTSITLPALGLGVTSTQSKVGSFVNIPTQVAGSYDSDNKTLYDMTTQGTISGDRNSTKRSEPKVPNTDNATLNHTTSTESNQCSDNSSGSYKDALDYLESVCSTNSNSTSNGSPRKQWVCSFSGISSESAVSTDDIKEKVKSIGVSLLRLRDSFSFSDHVIYSLFIGRPFIIISDQRYSRKVSSLVYKFANFLPSNFVRKKKIVPWSVSNKKLSLKDLETIGIAGMAKKRDANPIPRSLRCYVSVLDYSTQTLHAPLYNGEILSKVFDTSKQINDESTFRKFVAQNWSELVSEAYVCFGLNYAHAGNFFISSNTTSTFSDVNFSDFKIKTSCDKEILKYFVETLKMQLIHGFGDSYPEHSSFRLNNKRCHSILNSYVNKKKPSRKAKS